MMKKKDVKKKCITKMKFFQKRFSPDQTSSGCTAGCGCESTIRMLRKNNQNLARALSDQKIETDHWYSEVLGLKGELQELQEKLLRVPDNMTMENVIGETEKQIKEYYDLIDKDFNSALDRIVQAVEKLGKVKQLVSGSQAAFQGSSSFFTRTPGSRINLGSSGSLSSPRQRAVPPMVSGHVLQPAMVPLAKLKINFNDGRRHFLVGEDNGSTMPTVEEQPSPENGEVSEEPQSPEVEEHQENSLTTSPENVIDELRSPEVLNSTNTPTTPTEGTPKKNNCSSRGKINSSPELETTKAEVMRVSPNRSRRGRGRARGRRRASIPRASKGLGGGKEASSSTTFDDPLEGPSWLLDVGRLQFQSRGRRTKRQRQCAKFPGDVAILESSDEDIDESEDLSPKFMKNEFQRSKSRTRKKAALLANTPKFSPSLSLDHSCLDSPTSTPVKPETLKVKGRKRNIKPRDSKLLRKIENFEAEGEDVSVISEQDKELGAGTQNTGVEASPNELGMGVDSATDSNKQVVCNGGLPEILRSESPPSPKDVDLTCKIITNMDITMPVSNPVLSQEDPRTVENNISEVLQEELKSTQLKKKFFKTREMEETCEEASKKAERTPFDLSMLNETLGKMPPFSSTRTTEKENLPPHSPEINECGNLCDVSVVLEDVMKQSVCSETPRESPKLTSKESQGVKLMSSHSSRKLKSVSGTMQKAASHTDDAEENKSKRFRKSQFDKLIESTPAELLTSKRSAKRTPNEDNHTSLKQESGGKKARTLYNVTGKEDLEECFVLVHRTPIIENHTPKAEKKKTQRRNLKTTISVLSDVQQEQQCSSEDGSSPQEQEEVEAVEAEVIVDVPSSPINPNDNTERNSSDVENKEEECEENTQTGVRNKEPEECTILPKDSGNEEHLEQDEDIQVEQLFDSEKQNAPGTPDRQSGFEGFEGSEKTNLALKPLSNKAVKSSKVKDVVIIPTDDDEENLSKFGVKRRAALKISTLKEAPLNRKMRRGSNNEVMSETEGKDGRSTSKRGPRRTKAKGRGRGRGKEKEKEKEEKEKEKEVGREKEKVIDPCEVIDIDLFDE